MPLHSGWHLKQVEVQDEESGMKSTLFYNAWIGADDGVVQLEEANCVQVCGGEGGGGVCVWGE